MGIKLIELNVNLFNGSFNFSFHFYCLLMFLGTTCIIYAAHFVSKPSGESNSAGREVEGVAKGFIEIGKCEIAKSSCI